MRRSRYHWLGPLLVFLFIASVGTGAALWVTRLGTKVARALPPSLKSTRAEPSSRELQLFGTSRPVPFSVEALSDHSFALDGAHQELECEACHPDATYAGTPRECAACHDDPHTGENGEDCARCHNVVGFDLAQFDHAGAADCTRCHVKDTPADHFGGQCGDCHTSTATWAELEFDHTGFDNCQSCHADSAPANHYEGQCSDCHTSTYTWAVLQFSHNGLVDCQSCHAGTAPANHYGGQCSNCHSSTDSWAIVAFNHDGLV
ncbi:MAG: hypothetical protein AB8I80_18715, partial [Anaerolineae bacterium]